MASTTIIHMDNNALVCEKEVLKKKKMQEQTEKKFRITVREEKKKLLEVALAEKMSAQTSKKRKLCIMKLAPVLLAQQLLAKKKSTINMYFNHAKQPLIDLSNSNVLSDPINSDSNLKEPGSFAISLKMIIVSNNTLPPPSCDKSKVIIIGSNNGTNAALSDNLDF